MTPEQKDTCFRLFFILPGIALGVLIYFVLNTYSSSPLSPSSPMAMLVFAACLVGSFLLVFFIIENPPVKYLREKITGYTLPDPPPPKKLTDEEQKRRGGVLLFLLCIVLGILWLIEFLPYANFGQVVVATPAMMVGVAGACVGFYYKEFSRRYGGALLGLAIGLLVVTFFSPAPIAFYIAAVAIPTVVGALIGNWWNSQDFVKQGRLQREAAERQSQHALQKEELRKLQAQHDAQQEAALTAKLQELKQAGPTPSIGQRSPEAQRIADEIRQSWNK